jgi:glycosyltransferase involved in cell wall biosynthesis
MKIMHIITGLGDGGAEAALYRLCKFDSANKHIVVSLMDEGKYGPLLKELGFEVYCLNMPSGQIRFSALIEIFKLVRQENPKVVQTWMYHADLIGGVLARFSGVRNVFWGLHNTTLEKGKSKRSTIFICKFNAILSRWVPKKIIYCAEKSRQVHEQLGFKKSIGVVVPNGYDLDAFAPSLEFRIRFRREVNIDQNVFLIGHVGRFDPQKDHKNLILALGILKQKNKLFYSILVGTGVNNENYILNNLIDKNDLVNTVKLLGQRNDIPVVMNGLDIHVLSSSAEAFPNVLAEAMACGTPCVTTNVGDAALIVSDTGWVVPPKNPQALADAILQAIEEKQNNPQAWLERKQACRNHIFENFSIAKIVKNYHRVWFS